MSSAPRSARFTQEFRDEFLAETDRLLRKRFMWFSGILGGLGLLTTPIAIMALTKADEIEFSLVYLIVIGSVSVAMYLAAFGYVLKCKPRGTALLNLTVWVVMIDGLLNVSTRAFGQGDFGPGLLGFMISHVLAALFLPWSPMQALKPVIPVMIASLSLSLLLEDHNVFGEWDDRFYIARFGDLLSPVAALPGVAIAWIRHSMRVGQFKMRFMHTRYSEVKRELVDARRIHESLFPEPKRRGPVRFAYAYQPMRQIGGDFLYVREVPTVDGRQMGLNMVVLDVTGHGIAAALTVNRIHGEIQRLYAEDPDCDPGEILRMLNRYVHLTLATHSVYVTAVCLRIDPHDNTLEYASGGHPPAFLRAVDGTLEHLPSTAYVLGACSDVDFDPGASKLPFGPGDSLVVYTDGATELRNHEGKMLGINGFQRMMVAQEPPTPGLWPDHLLERLDAYREGPIADDTLIIEIYRTMSEESTNTRARAESSKPEERMGTNHPSALNP